MSFFAELADKGLLGCRRVVGADGQEWSIWGPEKEAAGCRPQPHLPAALPIEKTLLEGDCFFSPAWSHILPE